MKKLICLLLSLMMLFGAAAMAETAEEALFTPGTYTAEAQGIFSMITVRITGVFSKCLISWLASADAAYGAAEIYVDGKLKMTLQGGAGKWGQSEVVLVLDEREAAEHTIEISVVGEGKRFTITAISVR